MSVPYIWQQYYVKVDLLNLHLDSTEGERTEREHILTLTLSLNKILTCLSFATASQIEKLEHMKKGQRIRYWGKPDASMDRIALLST